MTIKSRYLHNTAVLYNFTKKLSNDLSPRPGTDPALRKSPCVKIYKRVIISACTNEPNFNQQRFLLKTADADHSDPEH